MKKVRVKFVESIAGCRDPLPKELEAKYTRLASSLAAERDGKIPRHTQGQIAAAVDAARRQDEAVIRTGFSKDWAFKPGDEAMVSEEIAKVWEEQGILTLIPPEPVKKAA